MNTQNSTPPATPEERRRSLRLLLDVPLIVRGESAQKKAFQEETFTISVSAHGALLLLAAEVAVGQTLWLMNANTHDQREGRVAGFGSPYGGLAQVAVEFPQSAAEFWHIDPPPQSWNTSRQS